MKFKNLNLKEGDIVEIETHNSWKFVGYVYHIRKQMFQGYPILEIVMGSKTKPNVFNENELKAILSLSEATTKKITMIKKKDVKEKTYKMFRGKRIKIK